MTNSGARALFERNATACENAKTRQCRCACGGALHGVKHSAEWRTAKWAEIKPAEPPAAPVEATLDLWAQS